MPLRPTEAKAEERQGVEDMLLLQPRELCFTLLCCSAWEVAEEERPVPGALVAQHGAQPQKPRVAAVAAAVSRVHSKMSAGSHSQTSNASSFP